jgi:hypothetical protein
MNEQNHIVEIPELLSNRICKRLIFKNDGLIIEKPFSFDEPVFISAEDITAFRLGVRWIRGFYFVLGRQFVIELKHQKDTTTKIKLISLYAIRDQRYNEIWLEIVDQIYRKYFSSHLQLYVELYQMGQLFNLSGLTFHADGVIWNRNKKLNYNQLAVSSYRTYFVIHNKNNPKQNISFNFLNDWNAYIIQSLLKYIVEQNEKILSA